MKINFISNKIMNNINRLTIKFFFFIFVAMPCICMQGCKANEVPNNAPISINSPLYNISICKTKVADTTVVKINWNGDVKSSSYTLTLSNNINNIKIVLPYSSTVDTKGIRTISISDKQILDYISQMNLSKNTTVTLRLTISGAKSDGTSESASTYIYVSYKNCYSLSTLTSDSIRVVSYNLLFEKSVPNVESEKWVNRKINVERLFTACNFDIIGSQEALTYQVDDLLSALDDYGKLGVDLWGSDSSSNENEALFYRKSRFDVLDHGDFWYSITPDKAGSYSWDATYPRKCTWGKFKEKVTGKVFYVFNSQFHVDASQSRIESAKLLLEKVKSVAGDYPVICTGDLNSDSSSEAVQILLNDGTLSDSRAIATSISGCYGTYHGFDLSKTPTARIDYVLVTKDISVGPYRVIDEELSTGQFGSDHLPVVVDVKLK